MAIPTKGEEFEKLIHYLRMGQESCAMLCHLYADESKLIAKGWLTVSEGLKRVQHQVTLLAQGRLQ